PHAPGNPNSRLSGSRGWDLSKCVLATRPARDEGAKIESHPLQELLWGRSRSLAIAFPALRRTLNNRCAHREDDLTRPSAMLMLGGLASGCCKCSLPNVSSVATSIRRVQRSATTVARRCI